MKYIEIIYMYVMGIERFLMKYSKIVSKVVTQLNDLVSCCLDIHDDKNNAVYFLENFT